MAGKVSTKGKGKDDKNKGSKSILSNDDIEEPDFSLLRKPIHTSISGFGQARKIFDLATEELKSLLSDECDLLYECKVCRNLFRSLANFISHKRVYCKEKFNATIHGHFIKTTSTLQELMKIKHMEEGYQESLKENVDNMEIDENDERIPLTKDLTTIVEKLANNKGVSGTNIDTQVTLQKIPSTGVAVFQNIENGNENEDSMKNQVNEIENILSKNVAVLQSDGNFKVQSENGEETEHVIQISDDDDCDTTELKCKKCDMQFSTQKTLKFHMKYKHVDSRLVYPCPDCMEIFSTSWSVYRHLFKVHRKTAAQIRRMRESIQSKAFKMNNPPAFYEKRKNMKAQAPPKITEEERIDQENQVWMDKEWVGGTPRCGGCGRTFERRAALAAHAHTCAPRDRTRRPDKIQIQIRKDYHKGPTKPPPTITPEKSTEEEPPKRPPQEVVEPAPEEENKNLDENSLDSALSRQSTDEKSSTDTTPEKNNDGRPEADPTKTVSRLPFAQHAEKSNLMALRQRIIGDIVLDKLLCKKCNTQHDHIQNLYDHVAAHYKWMRYACKLCNFKHYDFDKLPEHVKIVHKLKGDKDFYFSTVKALDGHEAAELVEPMEEASEINENSPESIRPSRCSSDSSRLSDDSTSSNPRIETGSRKRKNIPNKGVGKRRRETIIKGNKDDETEKEDDSQVKGFEENSSDLDDVYEKTEKKQSVDETSVASRRPVRRRTKPKNEDFEYDLSNLLKMEAQGYRESLTTSTTKISQPKKKTQQDNGINYELLNKECCGALVTLSRKSVESAKAHMKTQSFAVFPLQKERNSNVFIRPLLPKTISRGEKGSPKKDAVEESKEKTNNTSNISNSSNSNSVNSNNAKSNSATTTSNGANSNSILKPDAKSKPLTEATPEIIEVVPSTSNADNNTIIVDDNNEERDETNNSKGSNVPPVLPIKFRRQSLEVMKNPIINKNIKDFTKAGMKTKILVIKPINRSKDGTQTVNAPLKFQTIKLKDTTVPSSGEDKTTDQVVVVKMPKVDRTIARAISESAPQNDKLVGNKNSFNETIETEDVAESVSAIDGTNLQNGDPDVTNAPYINIDDSLELDDNEQNKSEDENDVEMSSENMEIVNEIDASNNA